MQRWRQLSGFKRLQNLNDPRHAAGTHRMADIGLGRANCTKATRRRVFSKSRAERFDLDWITQRGAGAVGFDIANGGRVNAKLFIDLKSQGRLRRCTRGSDAVGAAVLVDRRTFNNAQNIVAIGQCTI